LILDEFNELGSVLKEIGERMDDKSFKRNALKFEKFLKSGEIDVVKATSYALWAYNMVCNQGVLACIGVDGYRIYNIPDGFPPELANRLLGVVVRLLRLFNFSSY